ncbi:hypothetical protein B0A48_17830 [Cryoendolithus antarcticus]|uniref:Ribosome biogenesis protein SLX9 n=1 Tax=Cryoendolithus antarcticus TaxID=1507870 RepID=A0A1V8SAN3_9PEZI|nr:hypothetical protein B0A48_17830 [Cryoendolithus antarcticus]
MAPITKKRTPLRARFRPAKSAPPPPTTDSALKPDKRTKRTLKHADLLSRVQSGNVQKPKQKRRRPAKSLAGGPLSTLADALPEIPSDHDHDRWSGEDEWEGISETEEDAGGIPSGLRKRRRRAPGKEQLVGKMTMRSLKHRPGAAKRKREMEGREMERMRMNMARLVGGESNAEGDGVGSGAGGVGGAGQQERWQALRKFIGGSMEKSAGFAGT